MHSKNMNGMYPIIRRQRRPLVIEPLPSLKIEPAKVVLKEHKAEPVDKLKSNAGENVSQPETE
jgi:hypothetical protein